MQFSFDHNRCHVLGTSKYFAPTWTEIVHLLYISCTSCTISAGFAIHLNVFCPLFLLHLLILVYLSYMKLYAVILSLSFFYTVLVCAGLQFKFWQTPVLSIPSHTPISSWRTRFSSAVSCLQCSEYLMAFIFQSIPSFLNLSFSGSHWLSLFQTTIW